MSKRATSILRDLVREIDGGSFTENGLILTIRHVIGILTPKKKAIPQKRTKARRGPMRDPKYRRWIAWHECVLESLDLCRYHGSANISDPAHTQNNGMRSKGPDSSCVPLCRKHHQEYDAGRAAFEKKYGVDCKALAAGHYARFKQEN